MEELIKATPQFHKDRGPLKKAVSTISATATAINDAIEEQDAKTKCWTVQSRFKGLDKALAAPHRRCVLSKALNGVILVAQGPPPLHALIDAFTERRYLHEGGLLLYHPSNGKTEDVMAFLFNDVLVFGTPVIKQSGNTPKYKFRAAVGIKKLQVSVSRHG